jgi:hypothetical protein
MPEDCDGARRHMDSIAGRLDLAACWLMIISRSGQTTSVA